MLSHLDTNTAADAELLRQNSDLGIRSYFDAQLSHPNDWARTFALLAASFRLAFVRVDDSNTGLLVRLISLAITRHSETEIRSESMLMMSITKKISTHHHKQ